VEAPVKRVAVFLSGLAATCTGAFIRSCNSDIGTDLVAAWCGKQLPDAAGFGFHGHCAGCAIAFVGLTITCLSAVGLVGRNNQRSTIAMVIR
jgi:hypothetical protein